ncbi:MAG TPA: MIP/aquaporin family protein [Parvibaculum sp.]
MPVETSRRLAAEALGTCLLVASVIGSGIMAEQLAGGNLAVALIGNTLATGAMLYVLITVLGPVSGAHFNPAVTLVFALRGEIAPGLAALYMLVQFPAALLGTGLAHDMFALPLIEHSAHMRAGAGQLAGEAVATFMLVAGILGALANAPKAVPSVVALTIVGGYWFTSSTSFANPAVALARAFTDSFSGIRLTDVPGFMLAQIAGAIVAAVVSGWLWRRSPLP